MKVCTDACLFGAWLAGEMRNREIDRALDIGAGTGLLSLMIAQQLNATIDAVEIDEAAAQQAAENMNASNWRERLSVHNKGAQEYDAEKYDLIFSNPPFFEGDLKSDDKKRNLALHSTELSLQELIVTVKRLLLPQGYFAVLLPYHRAEEWAGLAEENGLHVQQQVNVKQTPKHNYFRSMLLFGETKNEKNISEITIKGADNEYTQDFINLLKDYYLYL